MIPWVLIALALVVGAPWLINALLRRRGPSKNPCAKVGLDLAGLVALLPVELRGKGYTRFLVHVGHDARRLNVGLLLPPPTSGPVPVGNPPNVGLVFDAETGALLEIRPEGVGLGIK